MANADRLIEVFNEAKARAAGAERERFLAEACPGDPELKEQVISLLQAHEGAGDFLKNTILSPTVLVTEKPGDKIGRYKLLELIGEGGCGVVYMAEQSEPVRRKVALKVIKLGMDTKQVVARFEAERQALALMDHPNIAKVFDAGATDAGRPYFVMELVRGIKITDYCDQNHLTTTERLDLFIQVCQAIQHAHQKGIIHRDIKPSNVLVSQHDTVAVPKVIDFGIAKATSDQRLTDKTLFTAFEQFMGTPAYMSSEQAQWSGLDIDTRTDIYSLGVLLYELLTGQTPFDAEHLLRSGLDEMRRIIREEEPLRPSTRLGTLGLAEATELSRKRQMKIPELAHGVRGDLDWIVMKCLEKDRTRRYETANGLAADLKRHLENEPVMARPPSTVYRFQKAFRRNKLAVSAAAAVGVALVVGIMVSTWQAIEASRARNAEKEQRLSAQAERNNAQTAQKQAERQTQHTQVALTRLEIERAESMFVAKSTARGVAYLARLLRQAPANRVVAERLLSALSSHNYCLPSAPPLTHNGRITCAQFSPDGELVITTSRDATARIWSAGSGNAIGEPLRHDAGINWAEFNADGQHVVTASEDGTARVWNIQTRQPVSPPLRHNGPVLYAAFSPEGRRVVTASRDRTLRCWDFKTGAPVSPTITNRAEVYFACFSPDGMELLVAIDDGTARIFSCTNGAELARYPHRRIPDSAVAFPQYSPAGDQVVTLRHVDAQIWPIRKERASPLHLPHDHNMASAVFSPDGRFVATASIDKCARVWDAQTGARVLSWEHEDKVLIVRFSTDGTLLLTGSADNKLLVGDSRSGKLLAEPLRNESHVKQIQFNPNRDQALAVTGDKVVLWNIRRVSVGPRVLHHKNEISHAVFSPDGQRVATGSRDGTARVWDARDGRPLTGPLQQKGWIKVVRFSPNGQTVATVSDTKEVQIWDAINGEPLVKPDRPSLANHIFNLNFSPDGKSVAIGTDEGGGAWIFDAATGKTISHFARTNTVRYIVYSPDGRRLLTACTDGMTQVRDVITGEAVFGDLHHDEIVYWADFSPDGRRLATASRDKTVRLWDAEKGVLLTKPLVHADALSRHHSVQFSPDGKWIATAAGKSAQVWSADTGAPSGLRLEHESPVTSVRFDPDGKRLITATDGGDARVWDVKTGHALSELFRHRDGCQYAEFSPDGQFALTASDDGTARIWWVPLIPAFSPDWLPDLAEALSGRRMDDTGSSSVVPVESLCNVVKHIKAGAGRTTNRSDFYSSWTRWFFAESAESAAFALLPPVTVNKFEASTNALELANAARSLARATNGSPEWLKRADSLSGKAADLAPNNPEVLEIRAQVLERRGDRAGAISVLDEGIARLPTNPSLWKTKGTMLQQANRTNEALEALSKAIELASAASDAPKAAVNEFLLSRCSLLREMNRLGEAVMDYRQAKGFLSPPSFNGTTPWARVPDYRLASQVTVTLGATNYESGLQQVEWADGRTTPAQADGLPCRTVENARNIAHAYFIIDPTFKWSCAGKVVIRVEYFDVGPGEFGLDYDGFKEPYTKSKTVSLRETRKWAVAQFELKGGRFENSQNAHADFRLWIDAPQFFVRRVSVAKVTTGDVEAVSPPVGFLSPFPQRDFKAPPNLINLEHHYNGILAENWHGDGDNGLASLPTGIQTLAGTAFDVRGLIQTASNSRSFPASVPGIPVSRLCQRLHFLHNAIWGFGKPGTQVGKYVMHYADGQVREQPIILGEDILDFWKPASATNLPPKLVVAWEGANGSSKRLGRKIWLFKTTWENPRPDVEIKTIDFQSTQEKVKPFLIAITAE